MALTDNLVSVWELKEASGNALDSFGSNTLTDNNTVGAGTGKIIGARDFESGNTEYFSLADNASLSIGDIDFSISAWINIESNSAYKIIVGKGALEYELYLTNEGRTVFGLRNQTPVTHSTQLSTGTWHFVVAKHDATANQISISINGGAFTSASHSTGCVDGTGTFSIGAQVGGSPLYFDGLIEQVALWKNRALTTTDVAELYNSGNGLAYSSWAGGGGGSTGARRRRILTRAA